MDLQFESPGQISYNAQPEILVIKLQDFRDPDGNLIAEDKEIVKTLPTMIDPAEASVLEAVGAFASASAGASLTFNFVLNLLMSTSLNSMLSAIKNLQVIVHLTLLSVVVPANAQIFFGAIAELISFDPIEIDEIIDFGVKFRPKDDYALDEEPECEEATADDARGDDSGDANDGCKQDEMQEN